MIPETAGRSRTQSCCNLAVALALLLLGGSSRAQTAAEPSGGHNITGFWYLRFDSFNVPKATLLPSVTQKKIDEQEAADRHAVRWCLYEGMPALMESRAPLNILEGTTQIVVASELPAAVRHIYTDRTARPDPTTFDSTTSGFSLGHWEGNTLVVETEGFNDIGRTAIPGGGFRTPTSHLEERYQLMGDGKELEVTFTWTDPKVFAKPHTYAFRYYRAPQGFNAGEDFCDSNDQARANFLTAPPTPVQ